MKHTKRRSPRASHLKKKSPKKISSPKKESPKKMSPTKFSSDYNMKGMGILLKMYGQAGGALENEMHKSQEYLKELQKKLETADETTKEQIIKSIEVTQKKLAESAKKMKSLLEGAAKTAFQVAENIKPE
jgi:hypothetical protein